MAKATGSPSRQFLPRRASETVGLALAYNHRRTHMADRIRGPVQMPVRKEIGSLRRRAQRLREIAELHRSPITPELLRVAEGLDKRADQLEKAMQLSSAA
jgi:hypothetical protein